LKILAKIVLMSVGISIMCILFLGIILQSYSRSALKERVMDQLQSIVAIKETQLETYFSRSVIELKSISEHPELTSYMDLFQKEHSGNGAASSIGTSIKEEIELSYESNVSRLLSEQINGSEFDEVMIITTDGRIDFSTDESHDDKIVSERQYFISGKKGVYIQNFYDSNNPDEPMMIISMPIMDDGKLLGVIAGKINSKNVENIMIERSGLGDSGETFLIGKDNLVLTRSRFIEGMEFQKRIYTVAANNCVKGNSGSGIYTDYRGIRILEVYKWIPERDFCIMAKMDESEAFRSLDNLLYIVVGCSVFILLISLLAAVLLSKTIIRPLERLAGETKELSNGNLTHVISIKTGDELEILAKAINNAGETLLRAREMEKNYSKNLEDQLGSKTSEMKRNVEELEASKKAALNIMEDLSEMNAHLKELDQAKTDFLNIASHELKTPLTAISAYIEILDDYKGQFNEQQLQGLDAIKRNSNQLKMLINNILEISRLESGRFELNSNGIDLEEKLKTTLENLRILSDTKGIELRYHIEGIKNISTDVMRFEEILNNLVGNAIKFTDKGSVTVDVRKGEGPEDSFAIFSIIDTGVGIPENKIHNLFQNFYQVDSGISRRYGGTGLGLAITKRIVELQGGKITVESVVGKGTTFRFTLPMEGIKKKETIDPNNPLKI